MPPVLAVVRLYALAQRIGLAVQAKHESLSQTLASLGHCKADAASELLARALLGLVANIAQQPHSIWLAAEHVARRHVDGAFKRIGNQYKVVGACTGLANQLWAIMKGGDLPALMSHLVPAASCAVAMGLMGLDLSLPGSLYAQVLVR
ncbi:hypothetical protein WJX77_010880 [Trebouxia sp. C0004]